MAENIVEIAKPDSTNLVVDVLFPHCVPIIKTNAPHKIYPIKAPKATFNPPTAKDDPKTIIKTAPADAPDDIPSM